MEAMNPRNGLFWHLALLLVATCSWRQGSGRESQLRVGKALNVFVRFGYLGISMRVIPTNDTAEEVRWLFKEPTRNIYKVRLNWNMMYKFKML